MTDLKLEIEKSIARFSKYRRKKAVENTLAKSERDVEEVKREAGTIETEENSNITSNGNVTNNNVVVLVDRRASRSSTSDGSLSQRCRIQLIRVFSIIGIIVALIIILSR